MNDYEKVRKIVQGEKKYFAEAIKLICNPLFKILCGVGADEVEAENKLVACFTAIYKELPAYKEHEIFPDWIMEQGLKNVYPLSKELVNESSSFGEMSYTIRFVYIAHDLFQIKKEVIAKALHITDIKLEEMLFEGRELLYSEVDETAENSCLLLKDLIDQVESTQLSKLNHAEGHLEFCPECRERLFHMKSIKAELTKQLKSYWMEDGFTERVMDSLEPYEVKKRSWRYQLITVASIVVIFSLGVFIIPNASTWSEKASNYLKYGAFYNVWGEGEYAATDQGITFEVTSVEVGEVYLVLDYKVEGEWVDNFIDAGFEGTTPILDVRGHNNFQLRVNEREFILAKSNPIDEQYKKTGKIALTSPVYEEVEEDIELIVNLKEIAGAYGNWELLIPLNGSTKKGEMERFDLYKQYEYENKIKLYIKDMIRTPEGSRVNYHVSLSEQERARIIEQVRKQEGRFANLNIDQQTQAIIHVVNENGDKLLPTNFSGLVQNPNMDRIDFLSYIIDPVTYELKEGKIDREEALWLEVEGFTYMEPVDFSFSIPTALGENIPIDLEYDGDVYDSLTVREVEATDWIPAGLEFLIHGKRRNPNFQSSYFFTPVGQDPNMTIYPSDHAPDENEEILASFRIEKKDELPEQLNLQSLRNQIFFKLEEPLRIPFSNEDMSK
ncbi:DUF4179 domain-containing protein [Sutcliffiella halmapala]|uniref:DUF4179 domain-containing protein n=1 Tax=Sutcliffiella halmapala TaxID=79882 RepID=UPI000995BCDF|nr:DUF4179 domain-containing protein [Sutcliffiella halmapala]